MKKTLLTLAAVAITAGAWAQDANGLIDVTPKYYNFGSDTEADFNSIFRTDLRYPAVAWNINQAYISSNTGADGLFTDQQIANGNIMFGAFVHNQFANNPEIYNQFRAGYSLYDLGGNVGQVSIFSGKNSNINEAIQAALGLDAAPEIPKFTGTIGANTNVSNIMDWVSMMQYVLEANPGLTEADVLSLNDPASTVVVNPIRVRVRMEVNGYNNDMSAELDAFDYILVQNETGSVVAGTDAVADSYIDNSQFADEAGQWNPNLWVVREFDFDYNGLPAYIKYGGANDLTGWDNGSFLIRNMKVYILAEGAETYPNLEGKNYSAYYDELVDYSKAAVEPAYPEALYMLGDNNGWTPGAPLEATSSVDGVFTFEDVTMPKATSYFCFTNIASPDWDLINDGQHRYGPAEGTGSAINAGVTTEFSLGGEVNWDIPAGTYTFVVDFNDYTLTVTGAEVEPEPEDVVLYVRGTMNEWGTTDQMVQDPEDENIYTYKFDNVEVGAEFKIADANWGTYNYGGGTMEVYSNLPAVVTLVYNGGNLSVSNWVGGPMELTFNLETLELTVVGPNQPKDETGGVNNIDSENAPVEYYNLQGVKVANPDKGIYIIRQGNTTKKAVIR